MKSVKKASLVIQHALMAVIIYTMVSCALSDNETNTIVPSKCKGHSAVFAYTRKTLLKDIFLSEASDGDGHHKHCKHSTESCSGNQSCCCGCLCLPLTLKCVGNC